MIPPGAKRTSRESDAFHTYLAAKKTVDDRALNRVVWERLKQTLADKHPEKAASILEVGAGIGTMIERIIEWELLPSADIIAIDSSYENIAYAQRRLRDWGKKVIDFSVFSRHVGCWSKALRAAKPICASVSLLRQRSRMVLASCL